MEIKLEKQRPADLVKLVGVPDGWDARYLAEVANHHCCLMHVCRDDARLESLHRCLKFFAPETTILNFPAWDCLPYDRVSPNPEIVARRLDALGRLSEQPKTGLILTTVSAVLQRVPLRSLFSTGGLTGSVGDDLPQEAFSAYFQRNGYRRSATVREPGEFAFRGGIVDVFPPGAGQPYRLDFFGDELETIRHFDPMSQRTTGTSERFVLGPVSEIAFDDPSTERFREGYRLLLALRSETMHSTRR